MVELLGAQLSLPATIARKTQRMLGKAYELTANISRAGWRYAMPVDALYYSQMMATCTCADDPLKLPRGAPAAANPSSRSSPSVNQSIFNKPTVLFPLQ